MPRYPKAVSAICFALALLAGIASQQAPTTASAQEPRLVVRQDASAQLVPAPRGRPAAVSPAD